MEVKGGATATQMESQVRFTGLEGNEWVGVHQSEGREGRS